MVMRGVCSDGKLFSLRLCRLIMGAGLEEGRGSGEIIMVVPMIRRSVIIGHLDRKVHYCVVCVKWPAASKHFTAPLHYPDDVKMAVCK